ncbi:MAG TPA: hypothetical protein V6D47_21120, partial [Oscillatoriaceae cyanobacterium]
ACGAKPAPVAPPVPAAATSGVSADGAIWLPTLKTIATPVLDRLSPLALHDARAYVNQHQAETSRTVLALAPDARAEVVAVQRAIGDDALGNAALAKLILGGKLTAPEGDTTLLDALDALAEGPIASTIDRRTLLAETLAEIDVPGRITQGKKLTCESASTQIMLALRAPAHYARLVATLAGHGGGATLAGGEAIARVSDWDSGSDLWRSAPSRLLQPAFAVYGNAPLRYSNTADKNSLGQSGLTDPQLAKLLGGVFGTPFTALTPENSTPQSRLAALRAAFAKGWQVPVWLDWSSGHVVLAESEAGGRIVFDNPFGAMQSMESDALRGVLHSVYVPAN